MGAFDDAIQAHIAKGRLLAEGVTAHIADEHYIWANWSMSYALGGVKLRVSPDDKNKASAVLSKVYDGSYESYLSEEENEIACANCKALGFVTFNTWRAKLSQIAVYLCFGFIIRLRNGKKKCKECGGVFKNFPIQ